MNNSILSALKEGQQFDFVTLAAHPEETEAAWEYWWEQRPNAEKIECPHIINDHDSILEATHLAEMADFLHYREFFDPALTVLSQSGRIPMGEISRHTFREAAINYVVGSTPKAEGKPLAVFMGGGYGSGKSTLAFNLVDNGVIPLKGENLPYIGADVFKQLIPEYALIKAVGDGRASSAVHQESVDLATEAFKSAAESGRSFVFETSMAYEDKTYEAIQLVKSTHTLMMVGVITTKKIAVRRAMKRARESRRFPGVARFDFSHTAFIQHFKEYIPEFDKAYIFANLIEEGAPELVAEKLPGNELEIHNEDLFNSARFSSDEE